MVSRRGAYDKIGSVVGLRLINRMRQALFIFAACLTGVVLFIGVFLRIIAAAYALGRHDWVDHFGENHWQTFVYMLGAALITGLATLPVCRFWQRRLLK